MRNPRSRLALAGLALLVAGCAQPINFGPGGQLSPECSQRGLPGSSAVILLAQAVPSATLIPCIKLFPAGWSFHGLRVRNGGGEFTLSSDRAGLQAVQVVLTESCDVAGLQLVPSDEPDTHRYERIENLQGGFKGSRYYLFDGGCVTYRFTFQGEARAIPINDASLAVSFVTRDALRETVRKTSRGRLELDPAPDATR